MTQAQKLLQIATAQIGTAEEPKGSNRIKYNTDYYGWEVSGDKYPWCMVFVWWCFREAGLSALFYEGCKTASCTALMRWAQAFRFWVTGDYQPGDVLLYDWDSSGDADHVGIYAGKWDVSTGRYLTIEGNYDDRVCKVWRRGEDIIGAFRPAWTDAGGDVPDPGTEGSAVELPEITYGDTGPAVRAMQILLMGYGYKLPRYGADGEYGSETKAALRNYQLHNGLATDGICGVQTWKKLLGV